MKPIDDVMKVVSAAFETPIVGAAIERVAASKDAAIHAQAALMAAMNLPTAMELDRVLAQLRSISQRLEDVEDALEHLGSRLAPLTAMPARLAEIEKRVDDIAERIARAEQPA